MFIYCVVITAVLRERTLHKGIIQGEEGGSERERVEREGKGEGRGWCGG